MLDILEFNASLYSALEKEKKDKEIILNYGKHLAHARSESNIELQAANWLSHFRQIVQGEQFNKTPEGSKIICEELLPSCNEMLSKATSKGAPDETISQLKNARSFLSQVLIEANKAINSKEYEFEDDKARKRSGKPVLSRKKIKHSEEDDEGLQHKNGYKYLYITKSGRYVYPEDLQRKKERKPVLMPKDDLIKAGENNRNLKIAKNQHEKEKKAVFEAKTNAETDKAVEIARQNQAARNMMKSAAEAGKKDEGVKEAGKTLGEAIKQRSDEAKSKGEMKGASGRTSEDNEKEEYTTHESSKTKKEIVGPDALKKKKLSHSFVDDSYPDDYKGMSVDEYLSHATFMEAMMFQPT